MPEIGVAASIRVKQIIGEDVTSKMNEWLETNSDVEVIDIKFATSATNEEWSSDALIIYRKEF